MRSDPRVPDWWRGIQSRFLRMAYPWLINRLVITFPAIGSAVKRSARSCGFRRQIPSQPNAAWAAAPFIRGGKSGQTGNPIRHSPPSPRVFRYQTEGMSIRLKVTRHRWSVVCRCCAPSPFGTATSIPLLDAGQCQKALRMRCRRDVGDPPRCPQEGHCR